jgi:hypothetical protein
MAYRRHSAQDVGARPAFLRPEVLRDGTAGNLVMAKPVLVSSGREGLLAD